MPRDAAPRAGKQRARPPTREPDSRLRNPSVAAQAERKLRSRQFREYRHKARTQRKSRQLPERNVSGPGGAAFNIPVCNNAGDLADDLAQLMASAGGGHPADSSAAPPTTDPVKSEAKAQCNT
mmetsp:Transcript_8500/g.24180  ORF Transcript_8500/g.24180 Transcript_8500/m.24180 type:complete len:123 (-) Transcript_8500:411-779(-)